jgi:hypothetical protein
MMEDVLKYILLFGVLAVLIWLVGPREVVSPSTGETCVELVNRLWKQKGRSTASEEADFELCRKALRER